MFLIGSEVIWGVRGAEVVFTVDVGPVRAAHAKARQQSQVEVHKTCTFYTPASPQQKFDNQKKLVLFQPCVRLP